MSKSPKAYNPRDAYFLKAKAMGYRARSAFKLIEIDDRLHIIRPGMTVMDLASAPGSWLQVLSERVGEKGIVIGSDIQIIEPLKRSNVHVYQADVFDRELIKGIAAKHGVHRFDLMTSDIAPATTGMTGVDQYRSVELNLSIVELSKDLLRRGGDLVLKVFVGEDVMDLIRPIKATYRELRRLKPAACRDRSFEEYFICRGLMK